MNDRLRIGDAEREEAAHELGEHFALGRITADEHGERLEQIWAAKTSADLAPAFDDLPRQRPRVEATVPPSPGSGRSAGRAQTAWSGWPRGPLPRIPFPLKLLIALIAVVLVFTHLPYVIVALLVYLFVIRRFTHRHPRQPRWR